MGNVLGIPTPDCNHDELEPVSVCCGASAIEDTNFCASCRDLTGFERQCTYCEFTEEVR